MEYLAQEPEYTINVRHVEVLGSLLSVKNKHLFATNSICPKMIGIKTLELVLERWLSSYMGRLCN